MKSRQIIWIYIGVRSLRSMTISWLTRAGGRIEVIHSLRGIAALSVCWFHLTNGNPSFLPEGLLKASGRYGWLGVEIFFVISGFVVPYSLAAASYHAGFGSFGRFLWKRVSRLDPPYLASLGIVIALMFLSAALPGYRGEPIRIVPSQLFLHFAYLNTLFHYEWLNPVYWSLAIEFQYYLVIGMLFPLVSSSRTWVRLLLLCALSGCALLLPNPAFLARYLFLFIMGFASFQHRTRIIGPWEWVLITAGAALGVAATLGIPAAAAGGFTSAIILGINGTNRILAWLGSLSYSLYLLHVPVGGRIINLGERLGGGLPLKVCFLAAALTGSLASAYLLFRFVEKPCQRYASSIRLRSLPSEVTLAEHEKAAEHA